MGVQEERQMPVTRPLIGACQPGIQHTLDGVPVPHARPSPSSPHPSIWAANEEGESSFGENEESESGSGEDKESESGSGEDKESESGSGEDKESESGSGEGDPAEPWSQVAARVTTEAAQRLKDLHGEGESICPIVPEQASGRSCPAVRGVYAATPESPVRLAGSQESQESQEGPEILCRTRRFPRVPRVPRGSRDSL
jgi:hypothetical protein